MIRELATKGIDPNVSDSNGVRPIQYATIRLQTSAVDLLRSLGARLDNLFDAVNAGDVARVQRLLADGADLSGVDVFGTALHRAVASGQLYIANMLIDAGADLEAGGEPAQSHPLHLAALKNDAAMASLLIDRGAEIDSRDSWGRTPLMIAASNRGVNVAEVLLDEGADPTAEETVYRDTAIHYATLAGDTEMVSLLLARGVDVNLLSDHAGESPLRYAAQTGNPKMIELLLRVELIVVSVIATG
jgi:ankyrin repeat protein